MLKMVIALMATFLVAFALGAHIQKTVDYGYYEETRHHDSAQYFSLWAKESAEDSLLHEYVGYDSLRRCQIAMMKEDEKLEYQAAYLRGYNKSQNDFINFLNELNRAKYGR